MRAYPGNQTGQAWPDLTPPVAPPPFFLLRWWYRLSAPPELPASARFADRERVRRGRLAALILLGLLVVAALSLPELALAPTVRPSIALVALCCLLAIPLNRLGHVSLAGVLLLVMLDLAFGAALLTAQGGLDPLYLPGFYLLVTTELIAVSLLPPASVFFVALAHSVFIAFDVRLQVHTMMWDQMITTPGIFYSLIAGPIALQLIVAFVSYAWVRSAQTALRRADRAEEIAYLEHRDAERTRELEEGVRQLLAVHVRLANGDFNVRAPRVHNAALWQIANSLNNLIGRLASFAQQAARAHYTLQRTEEEAQRLIQAISASSGQTTLWPAPSGTPLDPVVDLLRRSAAHDGGVGLSRPSSQSSQVGGSPAAPLQPAPADDLPEWLRPLQ